MVTEQPMRRIIDIGWLEHKIELLPQTKFVAERQLMQITVIGPSRTKRSIISVCKKPGEAHF